MMHNLIVHLFCRVWAALEQDHAAGGRVMIISSDFEMGYFLAVFAMLGAILIGSLLTAAHLNRWHPNLGGAAIGVTLGFALFEAVPLFV
jgi:hypothetical protein